MTLGLESAERLRNKRGIESISFLDAMGKIGLVITYLLVVVKYSWSAKPRQIYGKANMYYRQTYYNLHVNQSKVSVNA